MRPAVSPPVLEIKSQWSELLTTLMKKGGIWS